MFSHMRTFTITVSDAEILDRKKTESHHILSGPPGGPACMGLNLKAGDCHRAGDGQRRDRDSVLAVLALQAGSRLE